MPAHHPLQPEVRREWAADPDTMLVRRHLLEEQERELKRLLSLSRACSDPSVRHSIGEYDKLRAMVDLLSPPVES
jgi:hypothetical protein